MFTLLFGLIFILMLTMNLLQLRADKRRTENRARVESRQMKLVKRIAAVACALALVAGGAALVFSARQETITLNVYNWGMNIADGSDDTLDIIAAFEEAYPHIDVNYSTYDSNETLYTKLSNGGITVDVIIPSDYMIARLIKEDMLLELDFENIPNYAHIDDTFKNTSFDPENKYSVPYTWGTVGIIYNTKYVDEADVTGWELLWNEKYAGKILMFDNSRDAFGIAQYLLGYDVNTTDKDELRACADKLYEQKPLVQQYVMDQIYSYMENEEAWIGVYYAGDCMLMMESNENLAFYLPENQGFNLFIDSMCIPSCAQEKEAAELFINFLCDPEISGANMDYICYASPISAAKEFMDESLSTSEVVYPSQEIQSHGSSYSYLPEDISRFVESLFMEVRNK